MRFQILSIFPDMFSGYFNESIIKRAQDKKIVDIKIHDLRDWATGAHRSVDDKPYGGGAGMVMRADVIAKAITQVESRKSKVESRKLKIILLSAKGKTWNQQMAKKYSKLDEVILVCGRYEGVDERVKKFIDEEISVGEYVLTGGELPAMIVVDSITRLLPGVLGNAGSLDTESHNQVGILEYPQYTRPEEIKGKGEREKVKGEKNRAKGRGLRVPGVLLSGDHGKIADWRAKHSKKLKK